MVPRCQGRDNALAPSMRELSAPFTAMTEGVLLPPLPFPVRRGDGSIICKIMRIR